MNNIDDLLSSIQQDGGAASPTYSQRQSQVHDEHRRRSGDPEYEREIAGEDPLWLRVARETAERDAARRGT